VVEKTDRNVDRSKGQKLYLARPAAQQQHDRLHTLLLFLIYYIFNDFLGSVISASQQNIKVGRTMTVNDQPETSFLDCQGTLP